MSVISDHKVSFGSNGAVAELVVIRVGDDDCKTELGFDVPNVAMELSQQLQQAGDILPSVLPGKRYGDFLIFQQNLGR